MGGLIAVEFEGKAYRSLTALARAYGVVPTLFHARLRERKWTVRQALGLDPVARRVTDVCRGSIYKITHVRSGCAYIGLTTKSVEARFREHVYRAQIGSQTKLAKALRQYGGAAFTLETLARSRSRARLGALERRLILEHGTAVTGFNTYPGGNVGGQTGKPFTYNGTTYESVTAFCAALGLDNRVFNKRRAKGWDLDACVNGRKHPGKSIPIEWRGVTYPSVKEFCVAIGVNPRSFESRAYRGWDLHRNLAYTAALAE